MDKPQNADELIREQVERLEEVHDDSSGNWVDPLCLGVLLGGSKLLIRND